MLLFRISLKIKLNNIIVDRDRQRLQGITDTGAGDAFT
jgi:hypothetical protein